MAQDAVISLRLIVWAPPSLVTSTDSFIILFFAQLHWISSRSSQPFIFYHYWPIQSRLAHTQAPPSFRHRSFSHLQSFLHFAFLFFYLKVCYSDLVFFLGSNSILSPLQAGFRSDRSTLDQILYLSQSISNRFNKPKPGSRTVFVTIDLLKDFGSIWQPAHFHKLILAGLSCYFVQWTQSFHSLIGALCVVFQNWKSRSFCVRQGIAQRSVLGSVLFSFFRQWSPNVSTYFPQLFSLCWWTGRLVLFSLDPCCCGGHTRSSDWTRALEYFS